MHAQDCNRPACARLPAGIVLALLGSIMVSACGSSASGQVTAPRASRIARCSEFARVRVRLT